LTLARFIGIAGEAANIGLGIPGIVEDTRSAPVVILGFLFGLAGKGSRAEEIMAEAATARLAMNAVDLAKLGQKFKTIDDKV